MYNVVIDGDDGGVALGQVHDIIGTISRIKLLYNSYYKNTLSSHEITQSTHSELNNNVHITDTSLRANMSNSMIAEPITPSSSIDAAQLYRSTVRRNNGLYCVGGSITNASCEKVRSWSEYINDVERLKVATNDPRCVEACVHRLGIIQERTRMFFLRNNDFEEKQQIKKYGGVFASVARINPFVMFERSVSASFAWEYMVNTCTRKLDTVITRTNGSITTIGELLNEHGVSDFASEVSMRDVLNLFDDTIACETNENSYALHNPTMENLSHHTKHVSFDLLKEIQHIFYDIHESLALRMFKRYVQTGERIINTHHTRNSYTANEYAIPFYGTDALELENIATSMTQSALDKMPDGRWYLQLKFTSPAPSSRQRQCRSIQDQLDCLFMPLFTETLHMISAHHTPLQNNTHTIPNSQSNERYMATTYTGNASLAQFIAVLGGLIIDIPCNEHTTEKGTTLSLATNNCISNGKDNNNENNGNVWKLEPEDNTSSSSPALSSIACTDIDDLYYSHYYYYYIYANLTILNELRVQYHLPPLQLRMLANHFDGEDDIVVGYLIADVVLRATKLAHYPVLQYLYGLNHIALTLSPLTDHMCGAMTLNEHPLPQFVHECLYVALATEETTRVHDGHSDALMEEYATAQNIFRLSPLDLTELAHNSVCMSSFYMNDLYNDLLIKYNGVEKHDDRNHTKMMGDIASYNSNDFSPHRREWLHKHQVSLARLEFRRSVWETEREIMRDLHFSKKKTSPAKEHRKKWRVGNAIIPSNEIETAGLSRWHYLTSVQHVEYHNVLDLRVRFPRTIIRGPYTDPITSVAAPFIARALEMRNRYTWQPPKPWERDIEYGANNAELITSVATSNAALYTYKNNTSMGNNLNKNNNNNSSGSSSNSNKNGYATTMTASSANRTNRHRCFDESNWVYAASDAVFIAYERNAIHAWPRSLPTIEEFHKHIDELKSICSHPQVSAFARNRLEILDYKFNLHLALNHANEAGTTVERQSANRDFYQANKVDTHIHMAAGMTPKQILLFILQKLRNSGDDIAMKKGDAIMTLGELFAKVGITEELTVDQLNVQADHTLFERFDNFNNKYNPLESGELRSLLLKTDNFMNGRYFAEMIREVFTQYARDAYTYAENRLSVYGINVKEWDKLATWFITHGMSSKHNKWVIQVPRVYKVFRAQNVIGSFGQYLENIFQPLWEASLHPTKFPTLHHFLSHVSGFDSVDNEATLDLPFQPISPWAWTSIENPPYNYYIYYLYANIRTLNEFRARRGFSTFALRPHCGESGSDEHLFGSYLCANGICHGINLRNDSVMQYLYYLTQIGLHVSPLSNNALFLRFVSNPFPLFFRRGLNVSLSTDDPMMFHYTQEPLIEEYSIAARVWGFSPNDLCELARNSVLQCGFDDTFKRRAIGDRYYMSSSLGNDPLRTHLSDIRVAYRFETYHTEFRHLEMVCGQRIPRFMMTTLQEREINEQNYDVAAEKVLLSTHDQEMEVMVRDIEAKREHIRVNRVKVDALRRKQRSLIDGITEIGVRHQEREDEEARLRSQQRLIYTRESRRQSSNGRTNSAANSFQDNKEAMSKRLLHWYPASTNMLHTYVEQLRELTTRKTKNRKLPPLHFATPNKT